MDDPNPYRAPQAELGYVNPDYYTLRGFLFRLVFYTVIVPALCPVVLLDEWLLAKLRGRPLLYRWLGFWLEVLLGVVWNAILVATLTIATLYLPPLWTALH